MPPKSKKCKRAECNNTFLQYNSLKAYCSPQCQKADGKKVKPPKPFSARRKEENKLYSALRTDFLSLPENQVCFIDGCYNPADTVEHLRGRTGPNFLDSTTWAACCWDHNGELERNPELSHKYQLSKLHNGKKGDLK